jgi:hypothetical protein
LRLLGGLTPFGRPLSSERLHRLASKQAGLSDFGNPSYKLGFDRLLASLNEEAKLTPLGRLIAREEVLTALTNRLQLEAHHQQHPEIGAAPIRSPIIMMGMGRSGTTILHELLALDPDNRVPATWEVDMPFPAPERATYDSDPRIAAIQSRLDRTDNIIPNFKSMHRMGARLPQECVRITTGEFVRNHLRCTELLQLGARGGRPRTGLRLSPPILAAAAMEMPRRALGPQVAGASVEPRRNVGGVSRRPTDSNPPGPAQDHVFTSKLDHHPEGHGQ